MAAKPKQKPKIDPEVLADVGRLFAKLHPSNSETEILSAVRLINKKLERVGAHISALGEVLENAGSDMDPEAFAAVMAAAFAKADIKDVDLLVQLARAESKSFTTPDEIPYADVMMDGHRHTLLLRGEPYRLWLVKRFYDERQSAPSDATLKQAIRTLQADAVFGSNEQHEVYLRVARGDDGAVYVDVGDRQWHAIKVAPSGWEVTSEPPVRFRRPRKPLPLPMPERGGSIQSLRNLCNLSDRDFVLFVVGLVDALIPGQPHPIFYLEGEPGAAKSSLLRIRRDLIDPIRAEPKPIPGTSRDLFVDLENSYHGTYDNISLIPQALSDALCQVATGGTYTHRRLYSDADLVLLGGQPRPITLTGVNNAITRPDLADRTIVLTMRFIPPEKRRTEAAFRAELKQNAPKIMGALLDLVVLALRNLPAIKAPVLPRMADFYKIGLACEAGFTEPGSFATAFKASADEAAHAAVDEQLSQVGTAVYAYMLGHPTGWDGTASDFWETLNDSDPTEELVTTSPKWPRDARFFGSELHDATPVLRKLGVNVKQGEREYVRGPSGKKTRQRKLVLTWIDRDKGQDKPYQQPEPESPIKPAPAGQGDKGDNGTRGDANGGDETVRIKDTALVPMSSMSSRPAGNGKRKLGKQEIDARDRRIIDRLQDHATQSSAGKPENMDGKAVANRLKDLVKQGRIQKDLNGRWSWIPGREPA
jgi:hypothetical protein